MNSHLSALLSLFFLAFACNSPADQPNFSQQQPINKTVMSKPQTDFEKYVIQFPSLKLPFTLKDSQLKAMIPNSKAITVKDAEQFICFKGNVYECVVSPEDSQTEEGIDIRNDFKVIGKITANQYTLLVYLFNDEYGYPIAIATTYTNTGVPIKSATISGQASDSNTLNCELSANQIKLLKTEYKYGHKNDPNFVESMKPSLLKISRDGDF